MKSAKAKNFLREIKNNKGRFLSIFFIVLLGTAFFAGLRSSSGAMKYVADKYYNEAALMDIRVLSTLGITDKDIEDLNDDPDVAVAEGGHTADMLIRHGLELKVIKVIAETEHTNRPDLLEGSLPEAKNECIIDFALSDELGYGVGDTIELQSGTADDIGDTLNVSKFKVTGIGNLPYYVDLTRGSSNIGDGDIVGFILVSPDVFEQDVFTEGYIKLNGTEGLYAFSDEYQDVVEAAEDGIEEIMDVCAERRYTEVITDAREEIEEHKQEIADGEKELADAKKELDDGKKELDDAKKEIDDGEKELADAKKELDDGKKELDDAKKEIDDGELELADAKREIDNGEWELADARRQLDSAEAELAAARAEIDDGKRQIAEGEEKLRESEEQLEAGWKEYEDGKEQLESGRSQLKEAWKQYYAGQKELEEQEKLLSQGKAELEAGYAQYEENYAAYETQKAAYEAGEAQYAAGMAQLEQDPDNAELRAQMEALRAQLDAAAPQIEAAGAQLAAAKQLLDEKSAELAAAEGMIEQAEAEAAAGHETLVAKQAEFDASEQKLEEAYAELTEGQAQLENGKKELAASKEKLENGEKEYLAGLAEFQSGEREYRNGYAEWLDGKRKYEDGLAEWLDGKQKYEDGLKEWEDGVKEYEDGLKEWEDGVKEYEDGLKEWEDGFKEYNEEYPDAIAEIEDGKQKLADAEEELNDLDFPDTYVLDRDKVSSLVSYGGDADRLDNLSNVFPVIFFLVAALVSLTAMTRMIEEQRLEIGTMKALGASDASIAFKYILYALIASVGGGIIGVFIGESVIPYIVLDAYHMLYIGIPVGYYPFNNLWAALAVIIATGCTVGATYLACRRALAVMPAVLMVPEAPKNGSRVLFEHFPWLWKRLNFSKKATIRNLFRYKKRFFMTIAGIGGCMALMLVGFGIQDSIKGIAQLQYTDIFRQDATVTINDQASPEEIENLRETIASCDGITETIDVDLIAVTLNANDTDRSAYLYVPKQIEETADYVRLKDRQKDVYYPVPEEGALITEKAADMLGVTVGDTVDIKLTDDSEPAAVTINNIVENYVMHYLYLSPDTYRELFGEDPDFNEILLKYEKAGDAGYEKALGETLLLSDACSSVEFTTDLEARIDEMLDSLGMIMWLLIVFSAILAFVVLYNLNSINMTERKRELATLKVLGFHDMEVAMYIYRENIILTVIGIVVGVLLGIVLHRFIITTVEVDLMMFGRSINILSFVICAVLTALFSLGVNLIMYWHFKKIDMIESLKSVE